MSFNYFNWTVKLDVSVPAWVCMIERDKECDRDCYNRFNYSTSIVKFLDHLINFTTGRHRQNFTLGSFRRMSAALIADLFYCEVRWRGLSLSAGAATARMRSKTTTNSAPRAAVTLSKQRPRPSERIIHRTYPIKSSPPTAGRPQTAPAQWQMSPERRKTCIHAHACPHTRTYRAGALVRPAIYSQVSAPSQCLRSPTPTETETP